MDEPSRLAREFIRQLDALLDRLSPPERLLALHRLELAVDKLDCALRRRLN